MTHSKPNVSSYNTPNSASLPPAISQEQLRNTLADIAKIEVKKRFLDYKPYDKQKLFHKLNDILFNHD